MRNCQADKSDGVEDPGAEETLWGVQERMCISSGLGSPSPPCERLSMQRLQLPASSGCVQRRFEKTPSPVFTASLARHVGRNERTCRDGWWWWCRRRRRGRAERQQRALHLLEIPRDVHTTRGLHVYVRVQPRQPLHLRRTEPVVRKTHRRALPITSVGSPGRLARCHRPGGRRHLR